MPELFLDGISKQYGKVVAVKDVTLKVEDGKIVSLLGPSGCGKTTTLRIIAGLTLPDKGKILLGGRDITFFPPEKRGMGMVFQNYAVWPHMTVFDNVAFPLKSKGLSKGEIASRVKEALELVRMHELRNRYPHQLSGGQQQRVALARALAVYPEVLLLDEPLSNLDARLREEMRFEIRELQRRLKLTAVYVTHDQLEAFTISDKIAVMNEGKILQISEPRELYNNPANDFVATFLGKLNAMRGEVTSVLENCFALIRTPIGILRARMTKCGEGLKGSRVLVGIRPLSLKIVKREVNKDEWNYVRGTVVSSVFLGDLFEYKVKVSEEAVLIVQSTEEANEGEEIGLLLDPERLLVVPIYSEIA
ncbi:MAG: ABC transporter ATP-binding protein [Fervidicoccaceae archaeon]